MRIENIKITEDILQTYLSLRELEGISRHWFLSIRRYLYQYLEYLNWNISQQKTIEYLKKLMKTHDVSSYRKKTYQIRKFLGYLKINWLDEIKLPSEPDYSPKRVTLQDIHTLLDYFKDHQYFIQLKALILLGATSGMRPYELYQLNPEDIDVANRIVYINHNPSRGQTTKTKKSRISFFNKETQEALLEYLDYFNHNSDLKKLFSKTHIKAIFKEAPIKVRDLRKFFSQEWERKGGSTAIKKILMGHSLKKDVDLMHYNAQSPEDLKKIYDKVGISIL